MKVRRQEMVESEVEVTSQYCYDQAAELLANGSGAFYSNNGNPVDPRVIEWRLLGDSLHAQGK